MTADMLFAICNAVVLPQWILLLVAPRWRWTQKLRDSYSISLALALVYAYLIIAYMATVPDGGFATLKQVKNLFANEYLLLAGWIHYLAFDLFVGSWIARDAQKWAIHHFFIILCLLFTFMLGPVGFLVYQLIKKFVVKKSVSYEAA